MGYSKFIPTPQLGPVSSDLSKDYSSNTEMRHLGDNNASGAPRRYILDECRQINNEIASLDRSLPQLNNLQNASLQSTSQSHETDAELARVSENIMQQHTALAQRITRLKATPGAANPMNAQQVQNCDQLLTRTFQKYQNMEMQYRRQFRQQFERQYRIVHPEASQQDVAEQARPGVFAQAVSIFEPI